MRIIYFLVLFYSWIFGGISASNCLRYSQPVCQDSCGSHSADFCQNIDEINDFAEINVNFYDISDIIEMEVEIDVGSSLVAVVDIDVSQNLVSKETVLKNNIIYPNCSKIEWDILDFSICKMDDLVFLNSEIDVNFKILGNSNLTTLGNSEVCTNISSEILNSNLTVETSICDTVIADSINSTQQFCNDSKCISPIENVSQADSHLDASSSIIFSGLDFPFVFDFPEENRSINREPVENDFVEEASNSTTVILSNTSNIALISNERNVLISNETNVLISNETNVLISNETNVTLRSNETNVTLLSSETNITLISNETNVEKSKSVKNSKKLRKVGKKGRIITKRDKIRRNIKNSRTVVSVATNSTSLHPLNDSNSVERETINISSTLANISTVAESNFKKKIHFELTLPISSDETDFITKLFKKFNFASFDTGAKLIANSKGMEGGSSLLHDDDDRYMMVPSSSREIWFVVQLSDEILIEAISIHHLELYSSAIAHFQIWGSSKYPSTFRPPAHLIDEEFRNQSSGNFHLMDLKYISEPSSSSENCWSLLGTFLSSSVRQPQIFNISSSASSWTRYILVRVLSIQNSAGQGQLHYYCTLTSFKVFGRTVIQDAIATEEYYSKSEESELNSHLNLDSNLDNSYDIFQHTINSIDSLEMPEFVIDFPFPFVDYHVSLSNLSLSFNNSLLSELDVPLASQPQVIPPVSTLTSRYTAPTSFSTLASNIIPREEQYLNGLQDSFERAERSLMQIQRQFSALKNDPASEKTNKKFVSTITKKYKQEFTEFLRVLHNKEPSNAGAAQLSILKRLSDRVKTLEKGVSLSGRFINQLNLRADSDQNSYSTLVNRINKMNKITSVTLIAIRQLSVLLSEEYKLSKHLAVRIGKLRSEVDQTHSVQDMILERLKLKHSADDYLQERVDTRHVNLLIKQVESMQQTVFFMQILLFVFAVFAIFYIFIFRSISKYHSTDNFSEMKQFDLMNQHKEKSMKLQPDYSSSISVMTPSGKRILNHKGNRNFNPRSFMSPLLHTEHTSVLKGKRFPPLSLLNPLYVRSKTSKIRPDSPVNDFPF